MGSRLTKQLIYGAIYFAVFALIAFSFYRIFFRVEASCTNNREDSGEEGLDCGGVCTKICLPEDLSAVKVSDTKIFYPTDNDASLLAKLQNPNSRHALRSFNYTFDLYDAQGKLIQTISGKSFLYGSEIKYIGEFVRTTKRPSRAVFEMSNFDWVRSDELPKPNVSVQDRAITTGANQLQVEGRIVSRDTVVFPKVTVLAIISGPAGQIGASETELDDLRPGESRAFTILHPLISGVENPRVDIFISSKRP